MHTCIQTQCFWCVWVYRLLQDAVKGLFSSPGLTRCWQPFEGEYISSLWSSDLGNGAAVWYTPRTFSARSDGTARHALICRCHVTSACGGVTWQVKGRERVDGDRHSCFWRAWAWHLNRYIIFSRPIVTLFCNLKYMHIEVLLGQAK